jgi:D-ribulokinase
MDHRSIEQTNKINETKNEVLKFVGDTISPEMETPKLLRIKENLKELYLKEDVKFFDLADWLVYKSTGHDVCSICTLVSKWTFLSHKLENGGKGWNDDYFKEVGLELETKLNYKRIGNNFKNVGEPIGNGITKEVAKL